MKKQTNQPTEEGRSVFFFMSACFPEPLALIPLTKGYVAIIDASDYDKVSKYRWRAEHMRPGKLFVAAKIQGEKIRLHRYLMDAKPGEYIDHVDDDGLNNTRGNLRRCTTTESCRKRRSRPNNTGFRGVHYKKQEGKFQARIRVNGKLHSLGYFGNHIRRRSRLRRRCPQALRRIRTSEFPPGW